MYFLLSFAYFSGQKRTSESVEIIGLNSPSSIEIIATDNSLDTPLSQNTDDFVSPIQTPEEQTR